MQGHPSVLSTPWVTTSTGSLGQGISAGCGLALGYKYSKLDNFVNVVVGDGELQEGQVWEALMFASHNSLHNLRVYLDYNKLQSDDFNARINSLEPLYDRLSSFGKFTKMDTLMMICHHPWLSPQQPTLISLFATP